MYKPTLPKITINLNEEFPRAVTVFLHKREHSVLVTKAIEQALATLGVDPYNYVASE